MDNAKKQAIKRAKGKPIQPLKNQYGVYGYSIRDGFGYTVFLCKDWC